MPAFGLSADIPLKPASEGSYLAKQGWDQSELQPAVAAAPLYGGIWALGGSVTLLLGVVGNTPPRIVASFPASKWGPAYIRRTTTDPGHPGNPRQDHRPALRRRLDPQHRERQGRDRAENLQ